MRKVVFFLSMLLAGFCQAQIERPVTWRFSAQPDGDELVTLTLTATIDNGWHVYSQFIGDDGPVPTSFTFEPSKEYSLVGKVVEESKAIKGFDKTFNMEIIWFAKQAVFTQKVKLNTPASSVKGKLEFMVCNDFKCLPPEEIEFTIPVKLPAKKADAAPEVSTKKESVVQSPATLPEKAEKPVVSKPAVDTAQAIAQVPDTAASTIGTTAQVDSGATQKPVASAAAVPVPPVQPLWVTFLTGLLGGFAAILMPCIFPLLPMTISFFTKRSGSRRQGIQRAMLYGASIIVIYVSLGLLITVLFGADALNELSTNGIFNFIFFLLLVGFAASFFGAFEIILPASWVNKADAQSDRGGWLGIFFMAATLALVSFSCTGPIIGTLLVQAASTGQLLGPAVGMFGFSFALALPFTLFSMFPSWLSSLPKSGGWLNSVKVVLGFLELALAFKFLSNVDLAYHWQWFDREVFLVLWIVIFGLLGLYLLGKLRFSHDSPVEHISTPRLFLAIISLAFTLYMIPGLWGAPLQSIAAFLPPQHTQDFDLYTASLGAGPAGSPANEATPKSAHKYSELFEAPLKLDAFFDYDEGLAYAKQVKKPILIDFTGHACVNCRKMEATVWPDPRVLKRLREEYVLIQLYVDDKTELADNEQVVSSYSGKKIKTIGNKWSTMQAARFNANSQPYYVLLDQNGELLAPPQGANYDAENFIRFLDSGQQAFNATLAGTK